MSNAQGRIDPMTSRKLLVSNPNTNGQVTERIRQALATLARPGMTLDVVNPADGPFSIETSEDRLAAVPNVLSLIHCRSEEPVHGYVLACFDDIAIREIRVITSVPAISMAEAAIRDRVRHGKPFTIVTTVHEAVPNIKVLVDQYGASALCTIRAAGIGVAEANAASGNAEAKLFDTIERALAEDQASAIVLGSGAFIGRAKSLENQFAVPFIDGLEIATNEVSIRD